MSDKTRCDVCRVEYSEEFNSCPICNEVQQHLGRTTLVLLARFVRAIVSSMMAEAPKPSLTAPCYCPKCGRLIPHGEARCPGCDCSVAS
jgi:hypothetical protein